MSNSVYPTLAGLTFGSTKVPRWSTKIQTAVSGKEYRSQLFTQPIYDIMLSYEFLRADASHLELQNIAGFFNDRKGSFDNFLYSDPDDNSVAAQSIGTGDGATTQFQLMRTYGGNSEVVMNVNAITGVYDNGSPVTYGAGAGKYLIDGFGLVTFGTAPVSGHALTWTGSYYYRARFTRDMVELAKFMYLLWEAKKVELTACLGNKI